MRAESIHRKIVTLFCFPPAIIILPTARSDILKPSVSPRSIHQSSQHQPVLCADSFFYCLCLATALFHLFSPSPTKLCLPVGREASWEGRAGQVGEGEGEQLVLWQDPRGSLVLMQGRSSLAHGDYSFLTTPGAPTCRCQGKMLWGDKERVKQRGTVVARRADS